MHSYGRDGGPPHAIMIRLSSPPVDVTTQRLDPQEGLDLFAAKVLKGHLMLVSRDSVEEMASVFDMRDHAVNVAAAITIDSVSFAGIAITVAQHTVRAVQLTDALLVAVAHSVDLDPPTLVWVTP
ncbi:hypothetical protein FOY51_26815 [Antrihabitans cavernicola]|uniref:Uncharacterized protein n=1 Tax=Antrihabitans cavernicola TaxID=2495913 RepID=A0A5A7S640_9NOCA|nr:hypothetical protein FOY51_26815 [Spelaeibacter cavernicola]